jgi:hypothetical protein
MESDSYATTAETGIHGAKRIRTAPNASRRADEKLFMASDRVFTGERQALHQ